MKKIFFAIVMIACVIAVGCSSSSDNGSTSAGSDGGSGTTDGGSNANAIQFAASNATWTVTEDVSFNGNGKNDVGAIAINHGVGTIEFQNESVNAFFFNATGVPAGTVDGGDLDGGEFAADRDYEIIGVQSSRLIVAFITCTNTDLDFIYYETTDGITSSTELAATGTCAVLENSTKEAVSLPAVSMPEPGVLFDWSITGQNISFDGTKPGSALIAGTSFTMYPFHEVDCSACASPGWFELHSLFWDPAKQNACLGILYLEQAALNNVELAYFVCLPSITNPIGAESLNFPATWTTP
jgi:hypothetical protein